MGPALSRSANERDLILERAQLTRHYKRQSSDNAQQWNVIERSGDSGQLIFGRLDAAKQTLTSNDVDIKFVHDAASPSSLALKIERQDDEELEFELLLSWHGRIQAPVIYLVSAPCKEHLDQALASSTGQWITDKKYAVETAHPDTSGHYRCHWHLAQSSGPYYCAIAFLDTSAAVYAVTAEARLFIDIRPSHVLVHSMTLPAIPQYSPLQCSPYQASSTAFLSPSPDHLSLALHRPSSPSFINALRKFGIATSNSGRRHSYQSDKSSLYRSASPTRSANDDSQGRASPSLRLPTTSGPPALATSRRVISSPSRQASNESFVPIPQIRRSYTSSIAEDYIPPPIDASHLMTPNPALATSQPARASSPVSAATLPNLDELHEMPVDGPLFRAHCKEMEERAYYLRRALKVLVKSAESVLDNMRSIDEAEDGFDRALHQLNLSSPNSVSALNHVYWDTARRVQGFSRKEIIVRTEEMLLVPLRSMIVTLKHAEYKRKTFDIESKAFYEHTNKYLAVKNEESTFEGRLKAAHADEKFRARRDRFSLARADYYTTLQDLALFKECATLSILTHYAQAANVIYAALGSDLDASSPSLVDLAARVDALAAQIQVKTVETRSNRDELVANLTHWPSTTDKTKSSQLNRASADSSRVPHLLSGVRNQTDIEEASQDALSLASPSASRQNRHPLQIPASTLKTLSRSPQQPSHDVEASHLRKKEGFLWANGRPITHQGNADSMKHWHKRWVVLAGGQLCEYDDDQLELVHPPINLRFATAKTAKLQDRRFTFEVITPSSRRIYQATSVEEVHTWVTAITNVIQSLLDGTSSVRYFSRTGLGDETMSQTSSPTISRQELPASSSAAALTLRPENRPGDNVRAAFAKFSKPLQRKTSAKYGKRDSVVNMVQSLSSGHRNRKESEPEPLNPYSTPATRQAFARTYEQAKITYADSPSVSMLQLSRSLPTASSGSTGARHISINGIFADNTDQSFEKAVDTAFGPIKAQRRQSKSSKERNNRALMALLEIPTNSFCADCVACDPRWTSWNIGIFICIRCSGLHRSLGSHISKVRSIDLDDWSDEQLQCMQQMGNERARLLWEPPDLPKEMRSNEQIRRLIHLKYVERKWHE